MIINSICQGVQKKSFILGKGVGEKDAALWASTLMKNPDFSIGGVSKIQIFGLNADMVGDGANGGNWWRWR